MKRVIEVRAAGAKSAKRYELSKNTSIKVEDADAVTLVAERSEVSAMEQNGNDLLIRFSDGTFVRLEGYFQCDAADPSRLTIADPVASQTLAVDFENGVCNAGAGVTNSLAYSLAPASEPYVSGFLPAAGGIGLAPLLGLGAAGIGGIAAAGGGSDGGGTTPPVDQTAPAAPVVEPTNGSQIKGTAEPGANVGIDLDGNGTTDATVPADSSGNWTYTPTTPVADGTTVIVKATDAAGNTSPPASVVVDRATPTPTITSVTDDVDPVTGAVAEGGRTDDRRPTIVGGGAEANATVAVFDGETQIGTTQADAAGNWSFTPGQPLSEGEHSFSARATDGLGNVSARSNAYEVTIGEDADTTPPAAPAITNVTDDVAPVIGDVANGGSTNDARPTLTGTAEPGATVTIFDGNTQLGTATADGSGNWTFTPPSALPAGAHAFTATATDAAGNTGAASNTYDVTVTGSDTNPPAAPVITSVTDDVVPVVGNVADGGSTNDTQPTLTGTAEPGSTVTIFDGTTQLGTATANGSGNWTFTPATALPAGAHAFTATATDAAGNTGPASNTYDVTITGSDTSPPAAPVITNVADDVAPVIGNVVDGGSTNDTRPTLTGTAEPGSTVTIFDGTTQLGTATANGSGNWTFTPATALPVGAHAFTATATDAAGNTGPASNTYDVTITSDTTPPAAPVITNVTDDVAPDLGNVADGGSTDDTRPTLTGTAEAGSTVAIFDGTTQLGTTTANGSGNWTFTPPSALPAGTHAFTATATDAAGNTSPASNTYDVTITIDGGSGGDTTPPAAPVITNATDDVAPDTGNVPDGGTTDDTRPTLTGTAEPGSTVTIFDGSTSLGTTTANGSGNWTFTPPSALPTGPHAFTARATDAAGNTGPASSAYDVTIIIGGSDTPATIGGAVSGSGPEDTDITGTLTASDPDGLTDGSYFAVTGAAANGTATIDPASGAWVYTPAANFNGSDSFVVTVTDDEGGTTIQTVAVTVIPVDDPTTFGGANSGTGPEETEITGTLTATDPDGLTDGTYFAVTGDAANGTASIDPATGAWTYTPDPAFTGSDSFTVTVTDDEGGTATQTITITVTPADDNPPTIGGNTDGSGPEDTTVTGTLTATDPDGLTDGSYFTVTGAPANGTAAIDPATGEWTYTPTPDFNGSDSFVVTITDDEGGTATQTITVTVTPVDDPAVVGGDIGGSGPEDTQITGTLTASDPDGLTDGSYFTVTGAAGSGTASIDPATGEWTYTPAPDFVGSDSFTVTITDDAGGTTTQLISVTVTAADTLDAVDDTATIQTGSLTAAPGTPQTDADTLVLGLAESTYNTDNSATVTIPADYPGELRITVSQTALLAVADAFRLDIYDAGGDLVYSANTPDSLVGDVAGLPVLGVVDDDTLVVTVTGLAPGTYTVVVRNDQSTLAGLLDTDGGGVSLEELDSSGLVIGAENEGIILDAVEDTLNGSLLGLPLNAGTTVRTLLDPLLPALYGLPVSEVVGTVSDLLDDQLINTPGVLDAVIDAIADNLLSNTLTLLQTTTITTEFTAYGFENEAVSGNVVTGGAGADDTTPGAEVTQVSSTNGNVETIASGGSTTIVGAYGELTIASNGAYTYTAYGDPASVGQSEVFTYTLSDGTLSDTATLTIAIEDTAAPVAEASITAIVDDTGTPGDWATNDTSPTIRGTLSAALAVGERVQVQVDGGSWSDATTDGTDWFFGPGVLTLGDHAITVRTIDALGNTTPASDDTQSISITATNLAPVAIAAGGGLLGLVGADALGLVELGNQTFAAFDPNRNLSEVVVAYDPVLSLGAQALTYSSAVAAELGLVVDVGFLGLGGVTTLLSTLTITSSGGGAIDNLAINELLKTVHFDQDLLGLPLETATTVLAAMSITATDGTLSDSDSVPEALDVALLANLFSAGGDPTVIEGTGADNTLIGTGAAETLYGFDGADTLDGGGGNDLLRGGAGADILDGGTGNDLLVYDGADLLIDGGAGFDTVLVESGGTFSLANLRNIEQVRVADQPVTVTLGEDDILAATGAGNRLILSGNSNVSVTLQDAEYDGQVLFQDRVYEQYAMGLATVLIEDPIVITVL